jgi:hypothetical protein
LVAKREWIRPKAETTRLLAEVGEIVPDLAAGELAFVDDGFIREGGHVEADGVLFIVLLMVLEA